MEAEAARKKALWERQKSIALKEHQAKLAQLEKQRAVRLHAERERMAQITQLKAELKETVANAERCTEKAFKRTLLKKANDLIERINELKQSTPLAPKRLDDAKQQKMVQQMLPDNIAAERLEKIADVKKQLAEAELELQAGECAPERQTEIRKKITELKRQVNNSISFSLRLNEALINRLWHLVVLDLVVTFSSAVIQLNDFGDSNTTFDFDHSGTSCPLFSFEV